METLEENFCKLQRSIKECEKDIQKLFDTKHLLRREEQDLIKQILIKLSQNTKWQLFLAFEIENDWGFHLKPLFDYYKFNELFQPHYKDKLSINEEINIIWKDKFMYIEIYKINNLINLIKKWNLCIENNIDKSLFEEKILRIRKNMNTYKRVLKCLNGIENISS